MVERIQSKNLVGIKRWIDRTRAATDVEVFFAAEKIPLYVILQSVFQGGPQYAQG